LHYYCFLKVSDTDHPALYASQFVLEAPHWICENKEEIAKQSDANLILNSSYDFSFQNKHCQTPIISLKMFNHEETNKKKYILETKSHFRGVASGQVNTNF
jgi:hypothetical protein